MGSTEPTGTDRAGRAAGTEVRSSSRPRIAPHVRLSFDRARDRHVLLGPESVFLLNETGAAILGLCDGERTVAELTAELRGRYSQVADDEVRAFVAAMLTRRNVELLDGERPC